MTYSKLSAAALFFVTLIIFGACQGAFSQDEVRNNEKFEFGNAPNSIDAQKIVQTVKEIDTKSSTDDSSDTTVTIILPFINTAPVLGKGISMPVTAPWQYERSGPDTADVIVYHGRISEVVELTFDAGGLSGSFHMMEMQSENLALNTERWGTFEIQAFDPYDEAGCMRTTTSGTNIFGAYNAPNLGMQYSLQKQCAAHTETLVAAGVGHFVFSVVSSQLDLVESKRLGITNVRSYEYGLTIQDGSPKEHHLWAGESEYLNEPTPDTVIQDVYFEVINERMNFAFLGSNSSDNIETYVYSGERFGDGSAAWEKTTEYVSCKASPNFWGELENSVQVHNPTITTTLSFSEQTLIDDKLCASPETIAARASQWSGLEITSNYFEESVTYQMYREATAQ